jgi:3-oxoadipate enol-lactonase
MTIQSGIAAGLFYEMTGPEDAPAIVFSHALGGDLSMWDRQAPRFAGAYRIIRYDLRGHGRSREQTGPETLKDLATDALQLLDQNGIERAHFCGLSLGGLIGQWLGMYAQHRLRSLVLVDSAPRMGSPEQWDERLNTIESGGLSAVSGATMSRWFTEEFREREPGTVEHFKSVFEATSPAAYISCAKVVRNASLDKDGLEGYSSIGVPTLVITGRFDSAAKPADCKAMASRIPGSQYVELAAAHLSPVEASEAFTQALDAFLSSKSARE